MSTKIFLKEYGSIISAAVSDNVKMRNLVKHIEHYFDKNHSVLFDVGPTKQLIFSTSDKSYIVKEFLGQEESDVKEVIDRVPSIEKSWVHLNEPFTILSIYLIRELQIRKKIRERDLVIMYFASRSYASRFNAQFPTGVSHNVMTYTVNHISDKFKYKTFKNNYGVVKDVAMRSHDKYEKILVQGYDDMANTYFSQIHNRIWKVLIKISNEYYDNLKEKRYLNNMRSTNAEDDSHVDYENSTNNIKNLADNTTNVILTNTVNIRLCQIVAERNKIPYISVYQTIGEIRKNETGESLNKLISSMLEVIYEADNSILARICTKDFTISAIKQLSVSNSSSESLSYLKKELDRMLDQYCSKYAMTQRTATKMSYRNAIYTYLVYTLISNKCG